MATELTSLFGNEINVNWQPRRPFHQVTHFPGTHAAVSMPLGSAGYPLVITGTLRTASDLTYAAARASMVQAINTINALAWSPEQTYTYGNEIFEYVVFHSMQLIGSDGKSFIYCSDRCCIVRFIAKFQSLL